MAHPHVPGSDHACPTPRPPRSERRRGPRTGRLIQRDLRVLARQRLEGPPVRHRPAPSDEAGLGQRDRPQAQTDDAGAACMCSLQ